jgi:uncharacterized membrane protein
MANGVLESEFNAKTYIMSMMSYLGILCLVPLLLNEEDEYVAFHARQGVVLWIWSVIAIFSLYVPVIGTFFFGLSAFLILIFSLILLLLQEL